MASTSQADVRMRGFKSRSTVDEAILWLDAQIVERVSRSALESVVLSRSCGRVLAHDVASNVDVPQFSRAMMDGIAIRASDVQGANSYNRLALQEVGSSMPGQPFERSVKPGQAVRIMTGAPMPSGADAVLPAEKIEWMDDDTVVALDEVPPGKHVGTVGEDVAYGQTVLSVGRRLRPQDLGVLSSIGVPSVKVLKRPQVRIVVTGNELLPAGTAPKGHQITDANGPMLEALVTRDGGTVVNPGIVPDERDAIAAALNDDADIVLVSGGSSVGEEDHAPSILAEHGDLAIHGIAMRPSSPTGMGTIGSRLVFLLPGNPVSCLCAYDFFAGRAIRDWGGLSRDFPYRTISAPLRRKLVSVVGRVDYARVQLVDGQVEPVAISGASVLTSTTRADGFVIVPGDSEGYAPSTELEVYLYD